jgi:hypothetical protein
MADYLDKCITENFEILFWGEIIFSATCMGDCVMILCKLGQLTFDLLSSIVIYIYDKKIPHYKIIFEKRITV